MRIAILIAGIAAALAVPVAAAGDTAPATFRVNGATFAMVVPSGYCVPSGKLADMAQLIAAGDPANVTHLTLISCDEINGDGPSNYTLIKTPVTALTAQISRPEFLKVMAAAFDSPELRKFMLSGEVNKQATENLKRALPMDLKLDGTIKPLGSDDTCVYLGGVVAYSSGATHYSSGIGICMTTVGDRVISINRYGETATSAGVLQLLHEAKDLVSKIKPVSGS